MLYKTKVRRSWYALCLAVFALTWTSTLSTFTVHAVGVVVQGTVTKQDSTPVQGIQVEMHTPDGVFSVNTLTDASGAYSFSDTLTPGTNYVVEVSEPVGYNRLEPHSQNFLYQAGDAVRTYNFSVAQTTKTITGTVVDTNGMKITDARIDISPYNVAGASSASGRTNAQGEYSASMIGGTWFAQAVVDLGEYTQRWISEQPPVRVDFASDTTSEVQVVNFVVTPATGKVTATLLNSDGNKLTTSNFVADITFRRADGVGTIRKVRSADSTVSVYLTPGIYNICAFHSDLQGKSFNPAQTTFVMTDGGDVQLGTVQAATNSGHLKGKVVGPDGKGLGNVPLMAVSEGGCDRPTTSTQPDGTFDFTVGAGAWTIGLNSSNVTHSQVAPVSATIANGQTVTGLNITLKNLDRTVTGNVVGSNGAVLTDYVGSAFVQSSSKGTKAYAPVVNGAFTIRYASYDIPGSSILVGAEATEGSAYTGSTKSKVTISGSTATKNLTVLAFDASVSGTLLLPNGTPVTAAGSDITVEGVDEFGNYVSTDVAANGTYNLPLAKGTWMFDYNIEIPGATNGLMNRPAGQNTVTVSAGQAVVKNLTVRQGTNTITGTVTNASGVAVARALVNLDNRPKLEDSASSKPEDMVSVTVETNESGVYTAKVPNGTYSVTVGDTPDVPSTQLTPDAKTVTVSGATTKTVNLKFETSKSTIVGRVKTSGKNDGGGVVNAWTNDGSSVSAPVKKDGTYSLSVTNNEVWHVAVNDLKGNSLMESATTDVKTKTGKNTVNLNLTSTGVTVPGPVTKTCSADKTCSVSLPDGASVTLPAFAVDLSGSITVTMSPSIDLDRTSTDSPATLAYEVTAFDSSGNKVSELDKPAEVTVPYSQSKLATNGLVEKRLTPTYYNPNTGTWEDSGATGLVDTKNNLATIKTEHFSKFSVTGTAKPAASITSFVQKAANKSSVTLELKGKNLSGKMSALLGKVKASKVTINKGVVTVIFPTKGLKSGKQTMTLTTGNGRTVDVSKTVTIKSGVPTIK
jgi:hypothetical protein